MAPTEHEPHRPKTRPTVRDQARPAEDYERQVRQAGRSTTNLDAHASAQSLREASQREVPQGKSRGPSEFQPNSAQDHKKDGIQRPARTIHGKRCALTSVTSAGVSTAYTDRHDENEKCSGGHNPRLPGCVIKYPQVAAHNAPEESGQHAPRLRSLLRRAERSTTDTSATVPRLSTPRSIHDLGSDYSRYFNPFATQNNSQQDLQAPALRPESSLPRSFDDCKVSVAAVKKRLSNPFKDKNRALNHFHSAEVIDPQAPEPQEAKRGRAASAIAVAAIPMRSGTPIFISSADPEKAVFYPWVDDRLGAPLNVPLYMDQHEDDDEMHMPQWDDDGRYKSHWREIFSKDNIVNTIGATFLLAGLFTILIVLPIISYTGVGLVPYSYGNPLHPWLHVNGKQYPLLQNLRTGLIDPDTPDALKNRKGVDGSDLVLVFSDEFNAKNRTFYPGDDPFWFAPDIWYGATQDLEWYDPDAVNTGNGTLQLQLDAFANHGLGYRSGMLNSWNQLCFKGGIFEVSISLPGPAGVHGLWPGAWTMGNLGRPGYLATTDGVWPYTYNSCDIGITPNQSQSDGLSYLPGQRLSKCTCSDEDHPSPGRGRGAPEIDIAEISGDYSGLGIGVATQSFQVAPFDVWYYPNYDFMENPNYNISLVNTWTGGPYQQAVSTTTMLNNDWYDSVQYQKYSFEYVPGTSEDSHITWFVGDEQTMKFDARAIGRNGNIDQRIISEEPMSIILNLGFSHSWVDVDMANLRFPTVMRIDYVRWYQNIDQAVVTCDPPGYETTGYIARHPAAYNSPNYTHWEQSGYAWPKNTLMHGCST